MEPRNPAVKNGSPGYFVTTRWSLVLASKDPRSEDEKAREALAQLCQIYWEPVHAYIVRKGFPAEDAKDLAQDFFMKILEPGFIEKADRERGKFRALLQASLENFLSDVSTRSRADKRGRGVLPLSLDAWEEEKEAPFAIQAQLDQNWSPERVFDARWALTISTTSLNKLRQECVSKGRERAFTELCPFLSAPADGGDYDQVSRTLGLRTDRVRLLVFRLRERYRALLRAEVAETVADDKMIEEELRYLYALLTSGKGSAL